MKKTNIILIIVLLTAIGCSVSKRVFQNEKIFTFRNLNLEFVIDLEQGLNSEDISPDYRIGLGEGIYPNINDYEFEISRNYRRILKPSFSLEIGYHYTKDSLVRIIMYEWNELKETNGFNFTGKSKNLKTRNIFDKKFRDLRKKLNKEFGKPSFVEIESDNPQQSGTYRNGVKWLNKNGMNCYLFLFGDQEGSFNQIRLAIYPD